MVLRLLLQGLLNRVAFFARVRLFASEAGGTSAVEFALLALPFFMVLLGTMQVGLIYLTQATLQGATLSAADNILTTNFAPEPTVSSIRSVLCAKSANMYACDATLKVELNTLQALSTGTVALSDGMINSGSSGTPLVLRTQTTATVFTPGLGSFATVSASAVLRRP